MSEKQEKEIAFVEEKQELIVSVEKIRNHIYMVCGQPVMLDSDSAVMYGVETRVLNQAVKRNMTRFPEKFCFQVTCCPAN